eukprot:2091474-Prymnesium_polylepis.1
MSTTRCAASRHAFSSFTSRCATPRALHAARPSHSCRPRASAAGSASAPPIAFAISSPPGQSCITMQYVSLSPG